MAIFFVFFYFVIFYFLALNYVCIVFFENTLSIVSFTVFHRIEDLYLITV